MEKGSLGFLMGLAFGVALGAIMRSAVSGGDYQATQPDMVDIASEQSFPASDAPAY